MQRVKRLLIIFIIVAAITAAVGVLLWQAIDDQIEPTAETANEVEIPPLGDLELIPVAEGFAQPTDIVFSPVNDDTRMYIVEQAGVVRTAEDGVTSNGSFLDISDKVVSGGELGLLGLVFDPDYANNRALYVNYTRPSEAGQETVIARFTASEDFNSVDAMSEEILLVIDQPFTNHNAGDLVFGPDGYLYIPVGDGGDGGDPGDRAQDLTTLLGKILRIDVSDNGPYSVPADNPFVDEADVRPEIWSYGWRNPWRLSFDSQNNDLFIADVGQRAQEEVNLEHLGDGGGNYGWRCYEGDEEFELAGCQDQSVYIFPIATYPHEGEECTGSITGGFVYRGMRSASLQGHYLFADFCTGKLYSIDVDNQNFEPVIRAQTGFGPSTFGEDNRGEIYMADYISGTIYQVVPAE